MSIGSVAATVGIIGGTSLLGAGASLIGADKQADAATEAANAQLTAHREGLAFQRDQANRAFDLFQKEQERFEPFRLAQLKAMGMLQDLADPNSQAFQLERRQSTEAIQKTLAAQGILRSGAQIDALGSLEAGLSQRRAQILSALAGTGAGTTALSAGQNVGGQVMGFGERVGSSLAQAGAINAQGIIGRGNAWAGAIGGFNNAIQGGVGNALQFAMLNRLFKA